MVNHPILPPTSSTRLFVGAFFKMSENTLVKVFSSIHLCCKWLEWGKAWLEWHAYNIRTCTCPLLGCNLPFLNGSYVQLHMDMKKGGSVVVHRANSSFLFGSQTILLFAKSNKLGQSTGFYFSSGVIACISSSNIRLLELTVWCILLVAPTSFVPVCIAGLYTPIGVSRVPFQYRLVNGSLSSTTIRRMRSANLIRAPMFPLS